MKLIKSQFVSLKINLQVAPSVIQRGGREDGLTKGLEAVKQSERR